MSGPQGRDLLKFTTASVYLEMTGAVPESGPHIPVWGSDHLHPRALSACLITSIQIYPAVNTI